MDNRFDIEMPSAKVIGETVGRARNGHRYGKNSHKWESKNLSFWEQIEAIRGDGKIENGENEIEITVEEEACEIGKYKRNQ